MNKIREENIKDINKVIFAKPFSYSDYCNLQINSKVVLSDSGSITEESNIMKFNAINLRDTNERQEGMSVGAVAMAHFNIEQIENLITLFEKNKLNTFNKIEDYDCLNFSTIFYKLLLSYTQYVNKHTWKK